MKGFVFYYIGNEQRWEENQSVFVVTNSFSYVGISSVLSNIIYGGYDCFSQILLKCLSNIIYDGCINEHCGCNGCINEHCSCDGCINEHCSCDGCVNKHCSCDAFINKHCGCDGYKQILYLFNSIVSVKPY